MGFYSHPHLKVPVMPTPFKRNQRKGWWYCYQDENGKWRLKKGGDSRDLCLLAIAAKHRDLLPVKLGMIDSKTYIQQQYVRKPIEQVIEEFERGMRDKRRGKGHIATTIGDICAVFGVKDPDKERQKRRDDSSRGYRPMACNWSCLADVEASQFERFLGDVGDVLSAVRRNRYRTALMQLVIWAVKRGWMSHNPLAVISRLNEDKDRRRVRRAMDEDQVWHLIDQTRLHGPKNGVHRSLYYWVVFRCGLRWSEMSRLRWEHVDLGDDPCLMLDASITKNARQAILPIPHDLAESLRNDLPDSKLLFKCKPDIRTWRRDLERAEIDYETVEGFAYRGSTRTTFATHLYRAGVDLRTAQELMRHSDPKLTTKHYQRVRLMDTRPAVEKLNRPKPSEAQKGCA